MSAKAASQSGVALIVRTAGATAVSSPSQALAGGVFIGQLEKAITQGKIGRTAGETATSFGLVAKIGLCHLLTCNAAGVHPGLSVAGGQVSLPAIVKFYPLYVR